jgi:hypothetical protein
MLYSIHPTKRRMSARIAKLTEEYLACGGVIEKVPSVYYYPIPSMKWIADRCMDYTTWNKLGGLGHRFGVMDVSDLGDGCSITRPCPFEGDDAR